MRKETADRPESTAAPDAPTAAAKPSGHPRPKRVVGVINMLVDMTERGQAEAALRESEDRYRTLFDLVPVAVYSCDAAGVIQTFNRRAAELWGREPRQGIPTSGFVARSKCSGLTGVSCLRRSARWPRW